MLSKILIANRGEIAVRIIRSCQEMGIQTVAVYSDADRNAPHVWMASESVHIGAAPAHESYLVAQKVIDAALQTGCDAIHPGYGFLSEAPDFAQAVQDAGLIFIGPPASAIRQMGVKTEARALMQAAGVPVVPGFQSSDATTEDFVRESESIGYPIMVKAAGGGGGKGIRVVQEPSELADAIISARREALHAFNDETIFLERYIDNGRHIEVQVLADMHGNVVHLFERECSVQRRHQKIVEESPSPFLTPRIRQQMGEAAVNAAKAVNYVNAGTVEFIVDADANFYFLEMNTRLQVEHPVTEFVTGIDLVKAQIMVASGEPLPFEQEDIEQRGHAIEVRIYAEDAANNFLPAIGRIHRIVEPTGAGIRVDSGITSGMDVTIHYDPMIAKLIVYSDNRMAAIQKMDWALSQYVIVGSTTNLQFLRDIIQHPVFVLGEATTKFIDEFLSDWQPSDRPLPDHALIATAIGELLSRASVVATSGGDADGDVYSAWAKADGFRI